MTKRWMMIATLLGCAATGAEAQTIPDYVDNRSDGASLIKSLYNAVNRREYARAYSYFSGEKPAVDYQSFVAGYADTEKVEFVTGEIETEGAAGSAYSSVPVAIRATDTKGKQTVFAGCYIIRVVDPAIQEPPYHPLHIETANLQQANGPLEAALPKACEAK